MGLSRLNLYRSGAAALEAEVNCLAVMAKIRQNAKYMRAGWTGYLCILPYANMKNKAFAELTDRVCAK